MEQISLTINGKKINCRPGMSILSVALENDIWIPTLCHHPHLEPVGACRICIVEDENSGRILASCVTPVSHNMSIKTDSLPIKAHRKNIMRLMMANHPESCIVCNKGNRCGLRNIAAQLGVGQIDLYPMPHYRDLEEANPFIVRDLSKCILCGKCIRADHELVVVGAIDYNLRGFKSRPAAVHDYPLEKSNCTFCGTCISLCPTGALFAKNSPYVGSPLKEGATICGFCGVGCSIVMGSVDGQIVEVNPSHEQGKVNLSTLCIRGHFAHDFLNATERMTRPLVRKDGELTPVSWEESLGIVAEKLLTIKKKNGPQSLGFFGSSKCSIEENYLFQKIARVILETNNIDNGGYLSGRSVSSRIHERLTGGGRSTPLEGLERAEIILVIGANPTQSAPVVGYYLKRASRMREIPIIVIDPRSTELVPFSSQWLAPTPHSDCQLINGLAAILYKRKAYNADFIVQFTEGFDRYSKALSAIDLGQVSLFTGIDVEAMERAASLLEGKKITLVTGHGILQQRYGIYTMDSLINLCLMTGSLGQTGKGFYLIATENNEMGACDMGTAPDFLPGPYPLLNEALRKHWEHAWHIKLSPDPGLNIVRMVTEAERGNLKALYIMGENPLRNLPQSERVIKALNNLEFLVVQDILHNETTKLADVVLPGAAFSEKGGSFTNLEGRIQSFEPVTYPPGDAKPDWEILDLLSSRMGSTERYKSLQTIREEISRFVPGYSELRNTDGECWIKETSHLKLFNPEGDGELISFAPLISTVDAAPDKEYPFKAILDSRRCHLGSGTRTGHSDRIKNLALKGEVEISLEDGGRLGIQDNDVISISSSHGTIERDVRLVRDLAPGMILAPKGFHGNDVMNLVALKPLDGRDSQGFIEVNVKIEKISA
ncbi:MAG: molybdopterin-dependent oxidoreductase [Pseudomonadota bacterium]